MTGVAEKLKKGQDIHLYGQTGPWGPMRGRELMKSKETKRKISKLWMHDSDSRKSELHTILSDYGTSTGAEYSHFEMGLQCC